MFVKEIEGRRHYVCNPNVRKAASEKLEDVKKRIRTRKIRVA